MLFGAGLHWILSLGPTPGQRDVRGTWSTTMRDPSAHGGHVGHVEGVGGQDGLRGPEYGPEACPKTKGVTRVSAFGLSGAWPSGQRIGAA